MLARTLKIHLWSFSNRVPFLQLWDWLPFVGGARGIPKHVPAYHGSAGPFPIVHDEGVLTDQTRGIGLRYFLSRPRDMSGTLPVVIFSIPMDWGRDRPSPKVAYFSEAMAAAGYIVLRIQHTDSDPYILPCDLDDVPRPRDYISTSIRDPETPHNRFLDIPFVIDTLEAWNEGSGPLAGHIDLARIGMTGYSFGAYTTLAVMGQTIGPQRTSYKDTRIKAGISCSQAPAIDPDVADDVYAGVDRPMLYLTGSRDCSWSEPTLPEDRTWAYHKVCAEDQYLVVLRGADHTTFGGKRVAKGYASPREVFNQGLITAASLAFWDAYLKDDEAARRWFDEEFPRLLGRNGKLSRK